MSNFTTKADSAAELLKADMGLEPSKVQVTGDGRQVKPPPPGSYAAMALEQQQAQRAAQEAQVEQRAPAPAEATAINAPPVAIGQTPSPEDASQPEGQPTPQEGSPRVQARFAELTAARRKAEREAQEAKAANEAHERELAQLRERTQALEQERNRILQEQLENMDPETRIRVLNEGKTRELLAETEQRIMGRLEKPLQQIHANARQSDMERVAVKYPAFDFDTHAPLIEDFQKRNPASTVEQAFRAVAEDHELGTRPVQRGRQVPPVPSPRTTRGSSDYVPPNEPQHQKSEAQVLHEEAAELRKLGMSNDPVDKRKHRDMLEAQLNRRFDGRFSAKK